MVQSGFRVGQLYGIDIRLHYSLLLIALLVTAGAAGGFLPAAAPGLGALTYLIGGVLTAALFIGSVLWHEIAHALVAQYFRIPVVQIVLFLFGGMAQIAREPERPDQEFRIAAAGPLSSFALALTFGLGALMVRGMAGAAAGYLAAVNLILALFNLLPGFPLDGGRVLRAILWQRSGSYTLATQQASRVGQWMAGLLATAGLLIMLGGDSLQGVWLLLIAFFAYSAAAQVKRGTRSKPLPLAGTPVRKVMRYNVPSIGTETPLAILAWKYMDRAPDQAYPVMDGDTLVGLVTALEVDGIPRLEWGKVRAGEVMRRLNPAYAVGPDEDLAAAIRTMDGAGLEHLPVIEMGRLVGMLNRRDIAYRT